MEIVGYGVLAVIAIIVLGVLGVLLYIGGYIVYDLAREAFFSVRMFFWDIAHFFHLTKHDYPPIDWLFDITKPENVEEAKLVMYTHNYAAKERQNDMMYLTSHPELDINDIIFTTYIIDIPDCNEITLKGKLRNMQRLAMAGKLPDSIVPVWQGTPNCRVRPHR